MDSPVDFAAGPEVVKALAAQQVQEVRALGLIVQGDHPHAVLGTLSLSSGPSQLTVAIAVPGQKVGLALVHVLLAAGVGARGTGGLGTGGGGSLGADTAKETKMDVTHGVPKGGGGGVLLKKRGLRSGPLEGLRSGPLKGLRSGPLEIEPLGRAEEAGPLTSVEEGLGRLEPVELGQGGHSQDDHDQ